MDSKVCLLNSSQYSWNSLFLSSLSSSKKLSYLYLAKMMMLSKQSQKTFLPKSSAPCSSQEFWNLYSITEAAEMANEKSKTDAMFKDNCSLIPREIMPYCLDVKKQDMGLLEQCVFKDFYHELLQKKQEKMEFLKPDNTAIVCEKHCSSAGSIDSGYRSFPSVESAYTCIEEEGVTLYVSDCRYDKDGKLICMTVGFSVQEDSTASSDSLVFDDKLSNESDSEYESSDESEEDFIVFDADSCDDGDSCSFDNFVFEGTADQIPVAMSMNPCCQPTLEITISQKFPDPHLCFCDDKNSEKGVQEDNHFQDNYNVNSTNTRTVSSSDSAGTVPKKKKVHFQTDKTEVHKIIAWDFAYRQARIGHWKNYVTDRLQFQRRIDQAAKIIEPILEKKISQMKN